MTAEIGTTSAPDDPSTVQPPRLCPFQLLYIRQTAKPKVIDDAIVVIGLRQKKHKHAKKAGATDGDSDGEKSTEGRGTDRRSGPVFFDFGSALNILDEGKRNEQDNGRAGKRKQQTYGAISTCAWLYPELVSVSPFQNAGTFRRCRKTGGRLEAEMYRKLSNKLSNPDAWFW